jgi:gluconokinase
MTQGKGARIVVLMGVSGSGKTTIGSRLAERMGAVFADADDYHPVTNKQKMAAGTPLTDEDRAPWLETLHGVLQGWFAEGGSGVMACSALKAAYRETLAHGMPHGAVTFCLLEVSRAELERRLAERQHEYMSPKLLDSQLATLEPPRNAMVVENNRPEDAVVGEILDRMER